MCTRKVLPRKRCTSWLVKLLPVIALLLQAGSALAQVTFIATDETSVNPGTSLSLTVPNLAQAGDLLIAVVSLRGGSTQNMTAPSGWTLIRRDDIDSFSQAVYWRYALGSDPGSIYSWSGWSSERAVAAMLVYRGVSAVNPIDISGGQTTASSKTITAPSVTATSVDPLLVLVFGIVAPGANIAVPGGGPTRRVEGLSAGSGSTGLTLDVVDKPMTGTGATGAYSANANKTADNIGQIIVIRPEPSAINHYNIANNASGVNCQPETITITAHDLTHLPISAESRSISISAQPVAGAAGAHGDFALLSGTGAFSNGVPDDGFATYVFGPGEAQVVLRYRNTWVQTINIAVSDGSASDVSGTANADAGYNQDLAFAPSGFRIVDPGGNVIPDQVAGVSGGPFYLQAIQTGAGGCSGSGPCTGVCTVPTAFANGASVAVQLASRCDNPIACQPGQQVSIANNGTTAIAANPASGLVAWTTKTLVFGANGEAAFGLVYPDVGAISLHARYQLPLEDGSPSGNLMTGASNSFVEKPYDLRIATTAPNQVKRSSDGFVNPAAATSSGPVFIRAGDDFSVTVTSVNLSGAPTPNYGQELVPESVTLTAMLASGLGLTSNPGLANPSAFALFAGGSATGTTFNWPEVGIINLSASVADGNYLGAGNVSGSSSGNVGRFVPFDFAVTRNAPLFESGCSVAGKDAFTYIGEPFVYQTPPVITVTARNKAGGTTLNYSGNFFRITAASLSGKTYTAASGSLDVSGIPAMDPVIRFNGDGIVTPAPPPPGVGSLTFSAGTGLRFARSTPTVAFDADIALAINVVDEDGTMVTVIDSIAGTNPVRFGQATSGNGMLFAGTTVTPGKTTREMRFGRLRMDNVSGTSRLALPLRVSAQYYTATGFVGNSDDSCSRFNGTNIAMAFVPSTNLSACETTAVPTGAVSLVDGQASGLRLAAPGVGNDGSVDLRINLGAASGSTCSAIGAAPTAASFSALDFLRGNWGGVPAWDQDPAARATFGIYRNAAEFLYLQENY